MFTGIIQELGIVKQINNKSLPEIVIQSKNIFRNSKVADSIAVNGVCLTVTKIVDKDLFFDCMHQTLKNTNLSSLAWGDCVNLESSLKADDKISGHFVTGHIDGLAKIKKITKSKEYYLELEVSPDLMRFIVDRACVSLDGISLTVAIVKESGFCVYLIPHTLENTTLGTRKENDFLNLECEIIVYQ